MQGSSARLFRIPTGALALLFVLFGASCGRKNTVVKPPPSAPPTGAGVPSQQPPPIVPVVPPPVPKPVPPESIPVPPEQPAGPPVRGPMIRIALTVPQGELRISSEREFTLVEKTAEAPRRSLRGQVQVRLERPGSEKTEVYRVQVASLANRQAADTLGNQLSARFSLPAVVHNNPATRTNQVRLGSFGTRREAEALAAGPLAEAGYKDAFVVREAGVSGGGGDTTLALRGGDDLFRVSRAGYLFLPGADGAFLLLNGKPYRGVLDLSLGRDGRIVVVNQLGMEEYLLGVVPAELSPVSYPEEAAQEAQAIAARTYALKNRGRFQAAGYDLTDDTSTQVYGGVAIEKSGSSTAVQKTSGVVIFYNDSPIDAMYTSTCGGRTEDSSNVFDTAPVPYLKSVICAVDGEATEAPEANLTGSHLLDQVLFSDEGTPANRELELATVMGLAAYDRLDPEFLAAGSSPEEIRSWVGKARLLAGRSGKEKVSEDDLTTRAGFIRFAGESFFGVREISRRVSEPDAVYYLGNFSDGSEVPASSRLVLAYLAQQRLWQPYPDNTVRPNEPIQRADALVLLLRWVLASRPELLKTGTAADPDSRDSTADGGSRIAVKRGNRSEWLPLAADVRLFKVSGGRSVPATQMRVIGNEKLAYHQKSNGEIDFLEVELSATGAASDRFSPVATWKVTISRSVVAEKLKTLAGNIGEIRDLKPAKLGESGRVVQVEIVGSRSSAVVNGYRVRNALGLKDTLYTLSRTHAEDGRISDFTFDGRGWGHGVGLCQTGAVGMARAGRSAEEILKTYYQGVELRKMY